MMLQAPRLPVDINDVLCRHCHMIISVDHRTWALACRIDRRHPHGQRKLAKANRRLCRRVRAFVATHDPATTDLEAKETERIFQAFMASGAA